MRKPSACEICRARRRKCIYPLPLGTQVSKTACQHCLLHGLHCVQGPPEGGYYAKRRARLLEATSSQNNGFSQVAPASSSSCNDLPCMTLRQELVDLYFEYIHDQFHSVYHRPSFTADVANDKIPKVVLCAIFALSARFSTNKAFAGSAPRERGEKYRVASEEAFSLRDLSPTMVQACLLLGAYAAASGETDVENMYYSTAGRMCLALDLPNRPVVSPIEHEVNIRTWWAVCMVDVWSSTAVRLPRIMPIESAVPLPLAEISFKAMRNDLTSTSTSENAALASPLLAEMVKLNRILSEIIEFNRACVSERFEGDLLKSGMRALARDLDLWLDCLPQDMRDTPENFHRFAQHGLGRMFAAVYLGYYHYGQLLHYQFLSSSIDAKTEFTHYADACKQYAARLCSLVYRSHSTPGSDVLYPAVSHILVIASTVQIHTLLFSEDERQIRICKSRLERNFELLLRLGTYWPSVDGAMSRLRAFHQTCLQSKETSFILDRWLLRFLVQFAPHMELEPRDNDPEYEALLALSKQSPLSCYSGLSV
ncbi:fungal-specific transcription factor domain-containing protein [Ampelomyces quisqualis]|uniref:Fungal-specific transcription factor domain-containing protein n=1 Tax=Ampelomyces quisqualis TaxID=50730 RepID=A0A6A5QDM6_AMPQU|nr:fungal-specific transcription factor domain-containing protein [Ampelomyces quisqualis]